MKINTPCSAFTKSVKYQTYEGPPTAHEITSANQVTPITTTSFMQTLPNVDLQQQQKKKKIKILTISAQLLAIITLWQK
jgi:hypothetical protein